MWLHTGGHFASGGVHSQNGTDVPSGQTKGVLAPSLQMPEDPVHPASGSSTQSKRGPQDWYRMSLSVHESYQPSDLDPMARQTGWHALQALQAIFSPVHASYQPSENDPMAWQTGTHGSIAQAHHGTFWPSGHGHSAVWPGEQTPGH